MLSLASSRFSLISASIAAQKPTVSCVIPSHLSLDAHTTNLDSMNIAIIEASGTDQERKLARAISPILKDRHLLLVMSLSWRRTLYVSRSILARDTP